MQWIHSAHCARRYHRGQAAWKSASSSRTGGWRWLALPFDGYLTRPCPLGDLCAARKARFLSEDGAILEPGRESAGSPGPWLVFGPGYEP